MHFFNEKASIPNMLGESWITTFEVHLGSSQIFFLIVIIVLLSFLMVDSKYGIA